MYAICHLSIVPIREESSHKSEQISQLLYGELCFIIKKEDDWCYIRTDFDDYEGWVEARQLTPMSEAIYEETKKINKKLTGEFKFTVRTTPNYYAVILEERFKTSKVEEKWKDLVTLKKDALYCAAWHMNE